jgi:outer membrane protein assembly factor BamE (lipoprotein component of BamABCDE complex)
VKSKGEWRGISALAGIVLVLAGCMTAEQHQAAVANADKNKLTVGTVQREIRIGMSGEDVIMALGSPNIVTTDERRQESWVYDRFATESVYSTSSGGVNALILGGGLVGSAGLLGGAAGAGMSSSAGARSTTQRNLTIVIKFDASKRVRDFAYRQSSF